MKAITMGAQSIMTGSANLVVSGGMESMSNVPYIVRTARTGGGYGHQMVEDLLLADGLTDVYNEVHMGVCAEKTAEDYDITREAQDAYALNSYAASRNAAVTGVLDREIVPVEIEGRRGTTVVAEDEEYKNLNEAKVPTLRTAFKREGGTITAANASKLNDGACAVVLASASAVEEYSLTPMARIVAFADGEGPPMDFPSAPAIAIRKLLDSGIVNKDDVAIWEINEAFSCVPICNQKELDIDPAKVNPNGGAVALGHPIGMSGARITSTLCYHLKAGQVGCAAICNGGGGATAILIEKL